ncbi:gliding motility-associated ABC transporter ATP-binding subunit GldA [Sphingobacteriaceae bacterium AH-315-L07]|nr:gliding motility-associated ABC transporter ATP-binding subunit GldA [Sphingobacteriaceae bacterium AH-315-L07]
MSIEINNLTKIYSKQKAVNEISFSIGSGEVVGFLGPNGAGKSTTMKIISCFIPQTSGEVKVCGYDVMTESIEVRKNIGYLPENNPLYLDMYVKEYLRFIGRFYKLNGNLKSKVEEMIEVTGLVPEMKKKIGALSKGFRQRVGLAQALIHDPKVIILDEPTSGLDPNQIVEIRELIKTLGKKKTVMLSTHIMQEVQEICDRVIIINNGEIVADDTTENIKEKGGSVVTVVIEFKESPVKEKIEKVNYVNSVKELGNNKWLVQTDNETEAKASLFEFAKNNDLVLLSMEKKDSNLEDVFQQLTK